ncbi:MAG: hypothetical protein M3N68_12610 [Actinomycetota bacterium]|nr:hypothetical protein [Actinomycetota bacterium]
MRAFVSAAVTAAVLAGCSTARRDAPSASPPTPPETEVQVVLRAGQTQVTGTVTALTAGGAVAPPVPAPFTITVPVRGEGGARITGALVSGGRVTVVWDGGRPLPVTGNGALDIGPARVEVTPAAIRWLLDGQPRVLTSGRYRLGATVAVGGRGLATPTDGAVFDADGRTALVTHGGARIELPPGDLRLEGPGTVEVEGRLHLRTAAGTKQSGSARFGEGSFLVKLVPGPGGYRIDGLFQGPSTR